MLTVPISHLLSKSWTHHFVYQGSQAYDWAPFPLSCIVVTHSAHEIHHRSAISSAHTIRHFHIFILVVIYLQTSTSLWAIVRVFG